MAERLGILLEDLGSVAKASPTTSREPALPGGQHGTSRCATGTRLGTWPRGRRPLHPDGNALGLASSWRALPAGNPVPPGAPSGRAAATSVCGPARFSRGVIWSWSTSVGRVFYARILGTGATRGAERRAARPLGLVASRHGARADRSLDARASGSCRAPADGPARTRRTRRVVTEPAVARIAGQLDVDEVFELVTREQEPAPAGGVRGGPVGGARPGRRSVRGDAGGCRADAADLPAGVRAVSRVAGARRASEGVDAAHVGGVSGRAGAQRAALVASREGYPDCRAAVGAHVRRTLRRMQPAGASTASDGGRPAQRAPHAPVPHWRALRSCLLAAVVAALVATPAVARATVTPSSGGTRGSFEVTFAGSTGRPGPADQRAGEVRRAGLT